MMNSFFTYGLLLLVLILLYLLFRRSGGTSDSDTDSNPIPGRDITGDANSSLRKWDCSVANRQLVLSDVPQGLTPYLHPFNEAELRKQPLEGFDTLISIAADIRLLDKNSKEAQELETPVRFWMSYNADDILALQKLGRTVDDLMPVKIVPGTTGWRPFAQDAVEYENIKCGEMGGVYITISSWGDPPTGWGSPKSS
jgi:hypothetical protein